MCVTPTPTKTPIGFCTDNEDCPVGQVCVNNHCVTPTPTPTPIGFCTGNEDCPNGEVCINNMCVTVTPTKKKSGGGGGGCNCEIDPSARSGRSGDVLAALLPALLLALRWRRGRALARRAEGGGPTPATGSRVAVDDQTVGRIVGRHGDGHPIARDDLDVIAAHAAADLRGELLALVGLDLEQAAGHHLFDGAFDLNQVVSRHTVLLWLGETIPHRLAHRRGYA